MLFSSSSSSLFINNLWLLMAGKWNGLFDPPPHFCWVSLGGLSHLYTPDFWTQRPPCATTTKDEMKDYSTFSWWPSWCPPSGGLNWSDTTLERWQPSIARREILQRSFIWSSLASCSCSCFVTASTMEKKTQVVLSNKVFSLSPELKSPLWWPGPAQFCIHFYFHHCQSSTKSTHAAGHMVHSTQTVPHQYSFLHK